MAERVESSRRVETLIASQYRILGIYVTFRCPLECAHCGVDSHPRRTERIDTPFVLEQIDQAARLGTFRTLHLNGGEPFLERRLLKEVSHKAEDLDLGLAITTSAHWATSLERARRVLSELPVLSQLMISTDVYHRPFVDLQQVAHAARAALEKGTLTEVAVCTRDGRRDEFVDRVCDTLGPELTKQVELILFPLDPVGRGAALPEAHWRERTQEVPTGRCQQINRPVLLTDGTLSACCNTLVTNKRPGDNPLKLGNGHDEGIAKLLTQGRASPYIEAIRWGGPGLLAQLALEYGAGDRLENTLYRKDDMCHLCDVILHDDEIQEALRQALAEPKVQQRIAILRALAQRGGVAQTSNDPEQGDAHDGLSSKAGQRPHSQARGDA